MLIFFLIDAREIQRWITAMTRPEVFSSLRSKRSGFSTIMTLFLSIVSCLRVIKIHLIPG